MFRHNRFLLAALGLAAFDAQAASLSDLYARVPVPPQDSATALSWIKDGQIVAPEYLAFKQALDAERAAIAALNGGTAPVIGAAPQSLSGEPNEVQMAVRGYASYFAANSEANAPEMLLKKRTRWLQAAMGPDLLKATQAIKPGTDAATASYNAPLLAKKQRLADQDMTQFRTLFDSWKKSRISAVNSAQFQLAATADGAKAVTPAGKSAIAQYRAAVLKEVDASLSITELAVKRAEIIASGKMQPPDASSGASKAKKAAADAAAKKK